MSCSFFHCTVPKAILILFEIFEIFQLPKNRIIEIRLRVEPFQTSVIELNIQRKIIIRFCRNSFISFSSTAIEVIHHHDHAVKH